MNLYKNLPPSHFKYANIIFRSQLTRLISHFLKTQQGKKVKELWKNVRLIITY